MSELKLYDNGKIQYSLNYNNNNVLKSIDYYNNKGEYIKTVSLKNNSLKKENNDKIKTVIKILNNQDILYVVYIIYNNNKITFIHIMDENEFTIYKMEIYEDIKNENINYYNLMIFNKINNKLVNNFQSLYDVIINNDTDLYEFIINFITSKYNLNYKKDCENKGITCLDIEDIKDIFKLNSVYYITKEYTDGILNGDYIEKNYSIVSSYNYENNKMVNKIKHYYDGKLFAFDCLNRKISIILCHKSNIEINVYNDRITFYKIISINNLTKNYYTRIIDHNTKNQYYYKDGKLCKIVNIKLFNDNKFIFDDMDFYGIKHTIQDLYGYIKNYFV